MYASWEYYCSEWQSGVVTEEETFNQMCVRACDYIDHITMMRAAAYYAVTPDPVSKATCAVVDALAKVRQASRLIGDARLVVSEKNDGFSQTYAEAQDPDSITGSVAFEAQKYKAAKMYLEYTGLLYRGVCLL